MHRVRTENSGRAKRCLRGGLVGFGFIGSRGHLAAYRERFASRGDVEIVAVADTCEARRVAAAAAWPGVRVYPSHEAMLAAEGNLDFVDICTPPSEHAAIAKAAFARGLHALCEKPMATTRADAASMLREAQRAHRVLFPCHNYKHAPVVTAIRDIVESGRIGAVRSATLSTFRTSHAKGVSEWNTHWRRQQRHSGGGIAMDHGSHTFYLAFEWMRSWPTAISARTFNLEPGRWDTEDNFSAVLTFPTGIVHAHLTWTAGVRKVLYTVQGELGAITADDDELQIAVARGISPEGVSSFDVEKVTAHSDWMDASHTRWFNSMFDGMVRAIDTGDFTGKDAQDAYRCVELITAGYESAHMAGREVLLGEGEPVTRAVVGR